MKKRFETRRIACHPIEVISSFWDIPLQFNTSDLSPRGAFIESELIPDMGEHLVCSFNLGNGYHFEFFGQVVRTNLMRRQTDRDTAGFGVEFLDATPIERIKIRDALRGTPPPLPIMRKAPKNGKRVPSQTAAPQTS